MDIGSTLSTVISIFLLLVVGYGAKKSGILKAGDSTVVNSIVINLTLPAFIFVAVHARPLTSQMIRAPFLLFASEAIVMLAAYAIGRVLRMDRRTIGSMMLVAAFGNTGFMGYPVVIATFAHDKSALVSAVMTDQFGMMMMLGTVGATIASSFAGNQFNFRNITESLKTPILPATILALASRNLAVPVPLMQALEFLAAATVPLAMISVGLGLSTKSVRTNPAGLLTVVVLKLFAMPIIMHLLLPVGGVNGTVGMVGVLLASMPSAVIAGVVSARFGANGAFAAGAIFVTTLLSIFCIPAVLAVIT